MPVFGPFQRFEPLPLTYTYASSHTVSPLLLVLAASPANGFVEIQQRAGMISTATK